MTPSWKQLSAGSRGLTPTAVKTANYTAAVGDLVLADGSGGSFTVTAPASPSTGDTFAVKKIDGTANAIGVAGTVDGDTGGASIVSPQFGAVFEYVGAAGWKVVGVTSSGGSNGVNGAAGNTVLTTSGAPSSGTGVNGDYAYDPSAKMMYGPKAAGAWPAGVSLQGPAGSITGADARYRRRIPKLLVPAMTGNIVPLASSTLTALRPVGTRMIVEEDGTLSDLAYFLAAVSASNVILGIYDTGDASSGNRTKLWDSGSFATQGAIGWQSVPSAPNISLTAGQQVDAVLMTDTGTTVQFGRVSLFNAAAADLGTSYDTVPGGASPKMTWQGAVQGSLVLPSTLSEASLAVIQSLITFKGRMA